MTAAALQRLLLILFAEDKKMFRNLHSELAVSPREERFLEYFSLSRMGDLAGVGFLWKP